ncbi:MAG: DUF3256 family protein [Microbacter sp.]
MKPTLTKKLFLFLLIMLPGMASASMPSLKQLFMSMPESVLLLDSARRSDLMTYYEVKHVDSIANGMNGYVRIVLWDEPTLHFVIQTSHMGTLEVQVFDRVTPLFIAVSQTASAPASLSVLSFYSMRWEPVVMEMPTAQAADFLKSSLSDYNQIQAISWLTPLFVHYSFDASSMEIVATLAQKDFLTKEDWDHLKPMLATTVCRFSYHQGSWVRKER